MLKPLLFFYIICFGCYVLFTREPDYFDSETIPAVIKLKKFKQNTMATFLISDTVVNINADYIFRSFTNHEKVIVIYNPSSPEKGSIYSLWGYWFKWTELVVSVLLLIGLYQLSISIIKNPEAEAYRRQIEEVETPARKYS